jgi:hypothetical protein
MVLVNSHQQRVSMRVWQNFVSSASSYHLILNFVRATLNIQLCGGHVQALQEDTAGIDGTRLHGNIRKMTYGLTALISCFKML